MEITFQLREKKIEKEKQQAKYRGCQIIVRTVGKHKKINKAGWEDGQWGDM